MIGTRPRQHLAQGQGRMSRLPEAAGHGAKVDAQLAEAQADRLLRQPELPADVGSREALAVKVQDLRPAPEVRLIAAARSAHMMKGFSVKLGMTRQNDQTDSERCCPKCRRNAVQPSHR